MGAEVEVRAGQVWGREGHKVTIREAGGALVGDCSCGDNGLPSSWFTTQGGWRLISDHTQPPGDDLVGRYYRGGDTGNVYRVESVRDERNTRKTRCMSHGARYKFTDVNVGSVVNSAASDDYIRASLCPAPTPESPPDGGLTGRYYTTSFGSVVKVDRPIVGDLWGGVVVNKGEKQGASPVGERLTNSDEWVRAHLCDPPEGAVGTKCEDCGAGVPPNVTPLACGDCLRKRLVAAKGQKAEAARRTKEEQRERNRASHRWNPYLVRGWVHCEDCGDSAENFGKCPTPGTRQYANGKEWEAHANTEWQGWAAKQPKRTTLPTYDGLRTGWSAIDYGMRTGRRQ